GNTANLVADFIENLQDLYPALAAADAVHDLQHPAGALAARRTLAARLVRKEPAGVIQQIDDAGLLVEDGHCRGAQPEAADLAGAVEVQRRVEFFFRHEAHAQAAGDAALGLAPIPDAAAVLVHQFAHRHAQRQFDAAG